MRKLIESTLVSLDGVIESPERWAIFDDEASQQSMRELDNYDAFIMGRVTYERFRDNWGPAATPTSTASAPCPNTSPPGPSTR
jgi:dihydrofolate reductase